MMKTTKSFIASDSRVDDNEFVGGGDVVSQSNTSKKSTKSKSWVKIGHLGNNNDLEELKFLIFKAKEAFNYLRQAFTKAPILRYFDSECYI